MAEFETAYIDSCAVYHLPGRDWFYLLGPLNCRARNLVFGLAEFPGGTVAAVHTHEGEEEVVYVLSGQGAMISGEEVVPLEPGIAVFVRPGLPHQIRVDGEQPLRLVTLFAPPVTPGAYDRNKG